MIAPMTIRRPMTKRQHGLDAGVLAVRAILAAGAILTSGPIASTPARADAPATAQRGFLDRVYRNAQGEHRYVVFVPHDYSTARAWPVILFLHGAGERGTDGHKPVEVGLGPAIRKREKTFPFIAVFPQCASEGSPRGKWSPRAPDGKRALHILAQVEQTYRTDPDRVYLTGLSMGGYGAWSHAAADPGRWAAVVPICGGGDPAWAERLVDVPLWCFHGDADPVVPVEQSRQMIAALRGAGGAPRYTELPGVGHNAWDAAYDNGDLYTWLLEQRRSPDGP